MIEKLTSESSSPDISETIQPYANSNDHLWHELERIDQLIRAQTVRWHMTIGASKPEHLWGMIHVTELEVDAYLNAPFIPLDRLPNSLMRVMAPYWQRAKSLAEAIKLRRVQTPSSVFLRLDGLQRLFSLSEVERDIVLICLLPELDERYRRLFGYLMDDASRTKPTVGLIQQILYPVARPSGEGRSAFETSSPLLAKHILVRDEAGSGALPLAMQSVCLDDRVTSFLVGDDKTDSRLTQNLFYPAESLEWQDLIIEPDQHTRLQHLARWWAQYRRRQHAAITYLHGPYGSSRLAAAQALCTATQTPLIVVDVSAALRAPEGWEMIVDLSYREASFQQAALFWRGVETLLATDHPPHRWLYLIKQAEHHPGLTFLAGEASWDPAGQFYDRPFLRLEFPMPGYDLRRRLWERQLPPPDLFASPKPNRAFLVEALANSFQFTAGQIQDSLGTAWGQAMLRNPQHPQLTSDDLYVGCRRQSGRRLIIMAQRIESRTELTFDDLILPETNRRQLEELRLRISHRNRVYTGLGFEKRLSLGKGLIVLFTGSSGTGKTMAAELLAKEQRVDLYKVDLSAVVSKYVGETEKNLSQVFAEAEDANAIIFFDEADALFGKRGEVREARDRWANIEVNYLLQRVEEYAGVVIMASNLRQNIDEAFLRRIHAIVDFPFPTAEARYRILRGLFPTGLERPPDEEIRVLAERFDLAGGNLKNIVIDAAFRALAETPETETPLMTLRHLICSTAREYQKLGKPITKGDFSQKFYAWVEEDIL